MVRSYQEAEQAAILAIDLTDGWTRWSASTLERDRHETLEQNH